MGKNEKIIENEYGAIQSDVPFSFHLFDSKIALNLLDKLKNKNFANFAMVKIYRYFQTQNEEYLYKAMFEIEENPEQVLAISSRILKEGAKKYPINNWRKIPREEHLNHALNHLFAFLKGDTQDEHLEHALCRLMMSLSVNESQEFNYRNENNQELEGLWWT